MSHLANPLPSRPPVELPVGTDAGDLAAGTVSNELARNAGAESPRLAQDSRDWGRGHAELELGNSPYRDGRRTPADPIGVTEAAGSLQTKSTSHSAGQAAVYSMPQLSEPHQAGVANSLLSDGETVSRPVQTSDSPQVSGSSLGTPSRRETAVAAFQAAAVTFGDSAAHTSTANDSGPASATRDHASRDSSREGPSREDLANLKGRFLAVLNHEIRTPLSGIMGMTDLLMETTLDDEQREYVAATRACAETLFEVLNATLEYSALSGGRVDLESSEFHVQEVVQAAIAEHQFRAESKGLRLYATFEEGLPETIFGDALRLRQLLSHLISNGVKFTPNGEVEVRLSTVSLTDQDARLRFQVRDTGIGIAREQLTHIFDSFRQIDSGLARNYSGLGLGLALVEKLAALMKGDLRAESTIGHGSSFFVECVFQRNESGTTTAAFTTLSEPSHEPLAEAYVLLVEDNDVAQRIYTHVLNRGNYHVECASSGPEALRLAHRRKFDLVLMDLQMPGIDGIETTRNLRGVNGYEQVPILALTANSADEHRRLCLENGMQGFLTKPIPSEELLASVAHYLRKT